MEWIDVNDRLPTESDRYWVKTAKGTKLICWFLIDFTGGKAWGVAANGKSITHWQPLSIKTNLKDLVEKTPH